jgi:outer membrane lipoprotein SlyB
MFAMAGAALLGVATLAPTAATAQYYGAPRPYHYVNDHHRGYYGRERARDYRRPYYGDRRIYRHDRCDRGTGGTIIGAIAGGLLGNTAVGRYGDKTAGTIVGAGVGALAGRAIDRDC